MTEKKNLNQTDKIWRYRFFIMKKSMASVHQI